MDDVGKSLTGTGTGDGAERYFDSDYNQAILEEYKALRAEILRSANIISGAVWIGVSAFALTIAASSIIKEPSPTAFYLILSAVSFQSSAVTGMFLQELTKYARAGTYIREHIEPHLSYTSRRDETSAIGHRARPPMGWESWINDRRPKSFYMWSLFLLQMPNITVFLVLTLPLYFRRASSNGSNISIQISIGSVAITKHSHSMVDNLPVFLYLAIILDLIVVGCSLNDLALEMKPIGK